MSDGPMPRVDRKLAFCSGAQGESDPIPDHLGNRGCHAVETFVGVASARVSADVTFVHSSPPRHVHDRRALRDAPPGLVLDAVAARVLAHAHVCAVTEHDVESLER